MPFFVNFTSFKMNKEFCIKIMDYNLMQSIILKFDLFLEIIF